MEITDLVQELPTHSSPADRELLLRAYRVAAKAHEGQTRASGEPYIRHCLAVAAILAELGAPPAVIAAALLHDTVEDTGVTLEELQRDFGDEVAQLVDGVTKLTQLPRVSRSSGNGRNGRTERASRSELAKETLRKTFLAMGDDVRVVLIKLADRVHNMRTLSHLAPEKQVRIAEETLEIFAPLANRLGIWQMKWELEDLSFRYAKPEHYKEIADKLAKRRAEREEELDKIAQRVRKLLEVSGLDAEVEARPKHIYSIHRKMDRKGLAFEDVHDIRGVRIMVDTIPNCYLALGKIHNEWKPIPGAFDDYVATPKDNFYQSLHTAVIYDDGKTLELQIRTPEMHENAEYGIAAHWRYKEGRPHEEAFQQRILWLRRLMEWRQDVDDASDFVEAMKSDVFDDRVYVFTPEGDIVDLPADSTPVDFAYHIHTEIGHQCRGAKVNGKLVPLNTKLQTGDSVEILTSKRGGPSRDWLNPSLGMVKSQRARSKIRQWFRRQDREQNISHGRSVLEKELRRLGIEDVTYDEIAKSLNFNKVDDLMSAIGTGDLHISRVVSELMQDEEDAEPEILDRAISQEARESDEVSVLGLSGLLTHLARCCRPAPGDPIVGYITRGRGATIHRRDCPNVLRVKDADRERLVQVSWGQAKKTYPVSVRIRAYDRDGLMRDVSTLVTEEGINMSSIHVATNNSLAIFDMVMEITDITQLSRTLNRLEALPNVLEARRVAPG